MRFPNFLEAYLLICGSIIIGFSIMLAFWSLYPYQLFTFYTEVNQMEKTEYSRGDQISWKTDVFHHTNNVLCRVSRELQDGIIINYPEVSYVTKYGRSTFINNSLKIPLGIDPGIYRIRIQTTCHVNPIRDIVVERYTSYFIIK